MTRTLLPCLWLACLAMLSGLPAASHAQVYRCTASNGAVAFQDQPCPRGKRQTIVDVPSRAPPGYVPPPVATAPEPAAESTPQAVTPIARPMPLPAMYACVGAVNGKHYLARTPPGPYLAPLGVLGFPPQSLSQAYGTRGGAGVSAPELARPRIGGPRIATALTQVQDDCVPATHEQVCAFVQGEFDATRDKLRRASRDDQPPLEQRSRELQDQLRNCR